MSLQFVNEYANQFADIVTEQPIAPHGSSQLYLFNPSLWQQLGGSASAEQVVQWLDNNPPWPGTRPLAQKYAGHQFGHFNPYLGDGRGLLLGEVKTPAGEFYDLHLKGAGPTPYGRGGDGRAVLRSSIREYLGSEALAALSIPTTRALALTRTSGQVQRETLEPGAMLIRVAKTHVRFGHFEHCYYRRLPETQQRLWQYVIERQWPHLAQAGIEAQFRAVMESTAEMIALWQAYGFIHGVMNTDNMSLVGETFDFGPYAVLDQFQPEKIFNHTDSAGRYGFEQQPGIGLWNLQRLQVALSASMNVDGLTAVLDDYEAVIQNAFYRRMRQRLGLTSVDPHQARQLIASWMQLLYRHQLDFNGSFVALEQCLQGQQSTAFDELGRQWLEQYRQAVSEPDIAAMQRVNPVVTLRTHHLNAVIAAAEQHQLQPLEDYLGALQRPFDRHHVDSLWAQPPKPSEQVQQLSCSS